ncbi:MAG: tetratricopeptide repeat protein, partial [Vicinamibacteria bacterium]|nr:tetratricopeptide repeat protein [Vicinamibacteria bacterium]
MDENHRTAELRRKLEKDPASRLFAQLAEELRKDGRHEEAIAVARGGLEKNPNYPSARLTLARA